MIESNLRLMIEGARGIDWARAAAFYDKSPDGQWDDEAFIACSLMPHMLVLLEEILKKDGKL